MDIIKKSSWSPRQDLAVSPASSGTFQSITGGSSETVYESPSESPPPSSPSLPAGNRGRNTRNATERTPLLDSGANVTFAARNGSAERDKELSMSLVFKKNEESNERNGFFSVSR